MIKSLSIYIVVVKIVYCKMELISLRTNSNLSLQTGLYFINFDGAFSVSGGTKEISNSLNSFWIDLSLYSWPKYGIFNGYSEPTLYDW